ncbi:MAG: Tetratricopeptide 2 repeat protein [Pedosphaera sp.]|nr:Tetratricopeptide 2 repeat protein [Pedosphaera sp.]
MEDTLSAAPVVTGSSNRHLTKWLCLALALSALAVFWPVHSFEFLNYDDPDYLSENIIVQSGLTAPGIMWALRTSHASNWHPLTWWSHMLDTTLFGPNAGAHHLINVLFHAANAILLFLLFQRLTGATWRSGFVAALFLLHPMHVESVAWLSERKDVLSTFFWMLTLLLYSCYVSESQSKNPKLKIFYGLALICFALGLLSKPMVVTLPFVLLLLDIWPLRRTANFGLRIADSGNEALPRQIPFLRLLVEKIPFFALSLGSSIITFLVQKNSAAASLTSLPLGQRLANALVAYGRYHEKLFWPEQLSVLYPHPGHWPTWLVIVSGIILLGITVVTIRFACRLPYLPVGWFWFLGTLVPVIGLVQVGAQAMADRYSYIPSIGIFLMVAWGVYDLAVRWHLPEKILAGAGGIVLIACVVLTSTQLQFWRNSETLFRRALEVAYNDPLYRAAAQTSPAFTDIHNNYGRALADHNKFEEAMEQYKTGLSLNPNHAELNNNYGNALVGYKRLDEARSYFEKALRANPSFGSAHMNLGIAFATQGKLDEATVHFKEAVRLKPFDLGAHANFGNALSMQHKYEEAITEYRQCLRLNPNNAQMHFNVGNVFAEQNKFDEAIPEFIQATKLSPTDPNMHFNLGRALAIRGRRDEAITQFQEALRLKPDFSQAQSELNRLAGK